MKQHFSTYNRGMNKDISMDSIPSDMYFHAEDIRFFTNEGESLSTGINIKGHSHIFQLISPGEQVIGSTTIRNKIIFFTADSTDSHGRIYELIIDDITDTGSPTLIYDHPDMNFKKDNPIEAIGRLEDSCIERVVFSDYTEYTKSINIKDSCFRTGPYTSTTSYCGIKPKDLDIFQGYCFNNPIVDDIIGGGSLLTGMYQYAFKLITKDGKETLISQTTPLISMYPKDANRNIDLNGDIKDTNTGKSLKVDFDLSNIDLSNMLNLIPIRIFTSTINGIPEISQFPEIIIDSTKTNYSFIDSGTNLTTQITNEDYILNNFVFKTNKTFSTKDDLLLYSNIKESCFELDCVDKEDFVNVRWNGFNGLHNGQYITANQPGITTDPNEAKYVNPYNDESGSIFGHIVPADTFWMNEFQYNRQPSGIIGGYTTSGYLNYTFCLEEMDLVGNRSNDTYNLNDGYTHKALTHDAIGDPLKGNEVRGYKRGEVYRFGIVFFSKDKGEPSFVYPIGDIKFPSVSDEAGYETIPGTGIEHFPIALNNKSYSLGVEFNLNLPACLTDQICGYQIVRVERTHGNKNILAQGVIQKYSAVVDDPELGTGEYSYLARPQLDTIEEYADRFPAGEDRKTMLSFFSPETSYNINSPNFASQDYLKSVAIGHNSVQTTVSTSGTTVDMDEVDRIPIHLDYPHREPIKDALRVFCGTGDSTLKYVDNLPFRSYATSSTNYNNGAARSGFMGTNIICQLVDGQGNGSATSPFAYQGTPGGIWEHSSNLITLQETNTKVSTGTYVIDYSRYLFNQYGGRGYSIISRNTFHPVSNLIDKGISNFKVYQGDTFIGYYDFAFHIFDDNANSTFGFSNSSFYETIKMPIETSINLDLTHGFTSHKGTGGYDHDEDGVYDTWRFKEVNNRRGNMFEYNPVFSQIRKDKSFFAQPLNYDECGCDTIRDVRTYISDPKINGETIDSWSKIRVNNYKDVDSQYGAINRLLSLKDEVFFLQDRGFGYFSINPRAIITTSDGQPTELGSGVGLRDYKYLSTKYGCKHQWGCLASDSGIYYFDSEHKKIFSYTGANTPISDIKGFHGFLNYKLQGDVLLNKSQGGDNPILDKGVHCTFDYNKKEVIFTFLGVDPFYNFNDLEDASGNSTTSVTLQNNDIVFYSGIYYKWRGDDYTMPVGYNINLFVTSFLVGKELTSLSEPYRNGFTLVLDEMKQAFSHFMKYIPRIYLNDSDYILSPKPADYLVTTGFADDLYIHETGIYGSYYGEDPCELVLSVVVNSDGDINKILRYIEFNSTVGVLRDKGSFYDKRFDEYENTLRDETISGIRIYNQNQDSGKIDLTNTREFKGNTISKYLRRKFDKWRVKLPRNNQRNDSRRDNRMKDRFRSTYFVMELYFQNNNNKTFKINRIISHYDGHSF